MRAIAALSVGVVAAAIARARLRNWGATREEVAAFHPGDDLVTGPATTTTYAVSVDAPAGVVWSWLVQIGQDRGGMYSYEWLENLFGLDIHNADEIRDEWQRLAAGDRVRVVPQGKFGMPDGYASGSRWSKHRAPWCCVSSRPSTPGTRHGRSSSSRSLPNVAGCCPAAGQQRGLVRPA